MKKLIFLSGLLLIFAAVTCSSDTDHGTAKIHINFKENKDRKNSGKSLQGTDFPGSIYQIRVAVYSGEISASKKIFDKTFGKDVDEATISVISGPARILTIEGLSIFKNTLYRGTSDPTDLAPDETVTVPVTMEAVPFKTASLTINLRDIYDNEDLNINIFNHVDLLSDQVKVSVFTAESAAFNQDTIEDINISCDLEGDFYNNDITSFPLTIDVPAGIFLVIVIRGNSVLHPPSGDGFLTVFGAVFITESFLAPDSTGNEINIKILDCSVYLPPGDDDNGNSWNDYCECR